MAVLPDEGRLLGGKYQIVRKLGEGGMGEVLLARHTELDQLVAIKLLRSDLARDPVSLQRFLREARAVARVESEHVVRVFDVGRFEDGHAYIVMEYLEGEDLAQRLERGAVPVAEAVTYVLQAAVAVAEAHRVGVIHRDLKPSNLFLARRRDGTATIKVVDFGISKIMSRGERAEAALTGERALVGSPFYMAPEQLAQDGVTDGRTDVWALGLILFELLTADGPFEAESLAAMCARIMHTPAKRISEVRPDLEFPSGLEDVIDLCLAKDPKARFADAVDLAVALTPFGLPAARGSSMASELPTKPPPAFESAARELPPIRATAAGVGPTLHPVRVSSSAEATRVTRRASKRPWLPVAAAAAAAICVVALVAALARVTSTPPPPAAGPATAAPSPSAPAPLPASTTTAASTSTSTSTSPEPSASEPIAPIAVSALPEAPHPPLPKRSSKPTAPPPPDEFGGRK